MRSGRERTQIRGKTLKHGPVVQLGGGPGGDRHPVDQHIQVARVLTGPVRRLEIQFVCSTDREGYALLHVRIPLQKSGLHPLRRGGHPGGAVVSNPSTGRGEGPASRNAVACQIRPSPGTVCRKLKTRVNNCYRH